MKNQVIKTPTKGKEYFGFNDTDIVVSSKKHKSIDSLMGAIAKKGMLESIVHIPVNDISGIVYNQKNELINIKYNKGSKSKNFKITFDDAETRNAVASSLSEMKNLSKSETPESKIKPLLLNLLFAAIALLITVALTGTAYDAANGVEIEEFTGRRSGIKNLLVSISSALGPYGVGAIGGAITLFMLYRTFKRWQNPAMDIAYS